MDIKRRRWVIITTVIASLLVGALIAIASSVPFSSDRLRQKMVSELSERLDAEVELGDLSLRLFPRLHVKGTGLAIHHKGRRDVPPLISVAAFTLDADLMGLWRKHISRVRLDGLDIEIPPNDKDEADHTASGDEVKHASGRGAPRQIVIDELVADNSKLTIIPRRKDKTPKVWQMHELRVTNVGLDAKMPFRSVLTNAVPPGQIYTTGTFGPWQVDDPGRTPLDGGFTFDHADLGVFQGITGTLSAHGNFGGSLDRIDVNGETDTPDFTVEISGHPVPLKTKYHATVDGTNGDTRLDQIDASFLNTSVVAKGGVYDVKGVKGRLVTLDITMEEARLEDLMRLAVKTDKLPMTGALYLKTKFNLPPGNTDVVKKLLLDGRFVIHDGRFTNPEVQQKIAELSRRASVDAVKTDAKPPAVASDFTGRFTLGHGVLALPSVTFDVPGAAVQLAGNYGLETETIAFAGNLFMDAKISETTTGWKSLLLKMVDPFFRKEGRTVIPIKIAGTRNDPSFGLDVRRVFKRGGAEPGAKATTGQKR